MSRFFFHRIHSLAGLGIVFFLMVHFWINSRVLFGKNGDQFVEAVNWLQSIPYLLWVELLLIGFPIFLHFIYGTYRAYEVQNGSWNFDGSTPILLRFSRNRAFLFQRWTAWILIVGICLHVIQMRFLRHPTIETIQNQKYAMVIVTKDAHLNDWAKYLHLRIEDDLNVLPVLLKRDEVAILAPNQGSAILMALRDALKNGVMAFFYAIFVIMASFHAWNGLWTFAITWGIVKSAARQNKLRKCCFGGMALFMGLGLFVIGSIWLGGRL